MLQISSGFVMKLKEENDVYRGIISRVDIVMNNPGGCEDHYPSLNMDEGCKFDQYYKMFYLPAVELESP